MAPILREEPTHAPIKQRNFTKNPFFFFFSLFCLDMFIQHTAFLLNKGSQDRRRGILPPAVSNYCYGLLVLVSDVLITVYMLYQVQGRIEHNLQGRNSVTGKNSTIQNKTIQCDTY